jgi:hypothetical protein
MYTFLWGREKTLLLLMAKRIEASNWKSKRCGAGNDELPKSFVFRSPSEINSAVGQGIPPYSLVSLYTLVEAAGPPRAKI